MCKIVMFYRPNDNGTCKWLIGGLFTDSQPATRSVVESELETLRKTPQIKCLQCSSGFLPSTQLRSTYFHIQTEKGRCSLLSQVPHFPRFSPFHAMNIHGWYFYSLLTKRHRRASCCDISYVHLYQYQYQYADCYDIEIFPRINPFNDPRTNLAHNLSVHSVQHIHIHLVFHMGLCGQWQVEDKERRKNKG